MDRSIASRWRELSGENNWAGLLQPLDPHLRHYIIHYCQMAGAMGDLFSSKFKESDAFKQDFFNKACLVKGNRYEYEVTHFIYAGSAVVKSTWFGYIAVATGTGKRDLGRRDILVCWRGTKGADEWINNAIVVKRSASHLFPAAKGQGAKVHLGFHSLYTGKTSRSHTKTKTSARQQVREAVREHVDKYRDEETSITIIGFSLGGALATLTAMDIVSGGCNKPAAGNPDKPCMVTAFTFGSPRIGNDRLKSVFGTLGKHLHLLRVVNENDLVPDLPWESISFAHFGQELIVDSSVSNYLKRKKPPPSTNVFPHHDDNDNDEPKSKRSRKNTDLLHESESKKKSFIKKLLESDCHNLDVYAHGVAIKDMRNARLNKLDHDIALVNKHSGLVKEEYKIPKKWWTGENRKKMEQSDSGRWKVV